jgi:Transaldolase/Fructose-6-phosphate aldolase
VTDPTVAVLDIDGTLIDSNYQHALAWYRALRLVGEICPVCRPSRPVRATPASCTPPPAIADPPLSFPSPGPEGTVMAPNEKLAELSVAGVAVWLDDLSRDRIHSGDLQSLVDDYSVVGITTNPTIFAAAISASGSYDDQVHAMAVRKISVGEALRTVTAADVRDACDLLAR